MNNKIDWTKAPIGTTHHGRHPIGIVYEWYKINGDNVYFFNDDKWSVTDWCVKDDNIVGTHGGTGHWEFTKRPEWKPEVGKHAIHDGNECMIIAEHCGEFWCKFKNGGLQTLSANDLTKPVELIDGEAYRFDCGVNKNGLGYYCNQTHTFSCAQFRYDVDSCTNIIHLVPEVT